MATKSRFIRSLLLIAVVVSFISGCTATGPSYTSLKSTIPQLQSDNARMYFLREGSFANSGLTARVHLNGTNVVDLNMDGFAYADRPAGAVQIMIDAPLNPGEARQMINVESGKTYYFFVANNDSNINAGTISILAGFGSLLGPIAEGGGRFIFYQIPEAAALEKLKTKKLSGN